MLNAHLLKPALERVQYNVTSKLKSDLEEIFQDCLDFAKRTGGETDWIDNRLDRLDRGLRRNVRIEERIAQVLKKHLNMRLKKLHLEKSTWPNAWAYPEITAIDVWEVVAQRDVAAGEVKASTIDDQLKGLFKLIGEGVNIDTGAYDPALYNHVSVHLCIELVMFDLHAAHPVVEDMTAAEITGIFLHEIGHIVTLIESMKDFHHKATAITDTIRYASEKAQPRDIEKIEATLAAAVADLKRTGQFQELDAKHVAQIVNDIHNSKDMDTDVRRNIILQTALATLLSNLFMSIINSMNTVIGPALRGSIKTGDLVNTTRNTSYFERLADEFAARYGAGPGLSGAMRKMIDCYTFGSEVFKVRYTSSAFNTIYRIFGMYSALKNLFTPPMLSLLSPYEDEHTRMRRMVQDCMAIFKDRSLPPDVRDQCLKAVTEVEKEVALYNSSTYRKVYNFIWGTIMRATTHSTVVGAIINGNLAADYFKLLHTLDDYIRQPLYRQSARISQLRDNLGSSV